MDQVVSHPPQLVVRRRIIQHFLELLQFPVPDDLLVALVSHLALEKIVVELLLCRCLLVHRIFSVPHLRIEHFLVDPHCLPVVGCQVQ